MARPKRMEPIGNVALYAEEDEKGRLDVTLPEDVVRDKTLMNRLHHRVVDVLVENGLLCYFTRALEEQLAALGADVLSDFIDGLVAECRTKKRKADPAKKPTAAGKPNSAKTPTSTKKSAKPTRYAAKASPA